MNTENCDRSMNRFACWEDAYDTCRDRDEPMIVWVDDEHAKIFPSGAFKPLNARAVINSIKPEETR